MFLELLNIGKKNRSILKENTKTLFKLVRRKNNLNALFHCNRCMEKESTMHFCYMQATWPPFDLYDIKYYL